MGEPTSELYRALQKAFDFFNKALFDGRLPPCVVTVQRRGQSYGHFAAERFQGTGQNRKCDEIALDPKRFRSRQQKEALSTLVHEMVHMDQHHSGRPARWGYHNRSWGREMRRVGLVPSSTGKPGGKETGYSVSHYIEPGGEFDTACKRLLGTGFKIPYHEVPRDAGMTASSTKRQFRCPQCRQNAWAKPTAELICGTCKKKMH